MIEDKSINLKVAESKEEALWTKLITATKERMRMYEEGLVIEKVILEKFEEKLNEEKK